MYYLVVASACHLVGVLDSIFWWRCLCWLTLPRAASPRDRIGPRTITQNVDGRRYYYRGVQFRI